MYYHGQKGKSSDLSKTVESLVSKISEWIKQQVEESGKEGVVLGLSGGLDSAVTAALCKKALGKDKVLGVIMPCYSFSQDIEDAQLTATTLGIATEYIDLSQVFDNLLEVLPEGSKISQANLKPRLRMATLYYLASKLNYLVVGTGNKSEFMVGYFTKHGDGAVDIMPLADIYKTEVQELAKQLGIPEEIINKPPSAGLWEGQTDESEMGITYPELDRILKKMERGENIGSSPEEKLIKGMVDKTAHKRRCPPVCKLPPAKPYRAGNNLNNRSRPKGGIF